MMDIYIVFIKYQCLTLIISALMLTSTVSSLRAIQLSLFQGLVSMARHLPFVVFTFAFSSYRIILFNHAYIIGKSWFP